jgi:hypothetical protein
MKVQGNQLIMVDKEVRVFGLIVTFAEGLNFCYMKATVSHDMNMLLNAT